MSRFMMNRGGGEIPVPGNDAFTRIMLHFDGSFADVNAAGIPASWSAANGASTTTSQHKFGSGSYQGTSTGYIVSNQNGLYDAGASDFTVDFWMRADPSLLNTLQYFAGFGTTGTNNYGWGFYYDTSRLLRAVFMNSTGGLGSSITGATSIMDGNWHHLALVKTAAIMQIYVDGVASVTAATAPSGTMRSDAFVMCVGLWRSNGATQAFQGNIDEFRYSVGIARWTGNFTPPTGPYI